MMALNLPGPAEVDAIRRRNGFQKGATRLEEKVVKDKSDDRAWADCCKAVDKRDGEICRCCKRKTVRTLELLPNRGEHAHIVRRRKVKALMFDSRNVLKLCLACHQKFDKHQIEVVGKAADQFELDGVRYLNADSKKLKWAALK